MMLKLQRPGLPGGLRDETGNVRPPLQSHKSRNVPYPRFHIPAVPATGWLTRRRRDSPVGEPGTADFAWRTQRPVSIRLAKEELAFTTQNGRVPFERRRLTGCATTQRTQLRPLGVAAA